MGTRNDRRAISVLTALARGVLGTDYVPEVPARMMRLIAQVASGADRRRLLSTLKALDTRGGALALTGRPVPVSWLSAAQAERLLQNWQESRSGEKRKLGGTIISLALSGLYSHPGPRWAEIGYQGPMGPPPDEPKRLSPLQIDEDTTLTCDVVVVGSGAGGGCVAAGLAQAGLDVIVLEKGGYHSESDFDHIEAHATEEMYLYGMTLATTDLGVRILAGSTLGGGTVVNYTTSFRTPDYVLKEWTQSTGIDAFSSGEFEASLDAVTDRLGINTDSSAAGRRDALMEEGLKELGWHVDNMPRAVRGCTQDEACGFCGFGCRPGAKQSTMRTYLEDAAAAGARMVTGAEATKVIVRDGRATGVEGTAGRFRFKVQARGVVSAAGSIETPALLLRSGLRGEVGKHLRLHPGTAPFGLFDDEVRVWEGTLQARHSNEFRHWDGGYGPIFETVPAHPGAAAPVTVPWTSAVEHHQAMNDFGRLSFVAVLARDRSEGRVRIGRDGRPRVVYKVNAEDQRRIREGVVRAGRVLEASGARRIFTLHAPPVVHEPGGGSFEDWASRVRAARFDNGSVPYLSYHQMGSCRMGTDPSRSAVGPGNESHEVSGLFVADASAFPTASGVNPMLTIYGIAHRAAGKIAERLS